ncbi:MAG: hypothetical protein AVDCRST_MAG59-342, partial [uncultured Thermomicrobiales bacterium]
GERVPRSGGDRHRGSVGHRAGSLGGAWRGRRQRPAELVRERGGRGRDGGGVPGRGDDRGQRRPGAVL